MSKILLEFMSNIIFFFIRMMIFRLLQFFRFFNLIICKTALTLYIILFVKLFLSYEKCQEHIAYLFCILNDFYSLNLHLAICMYYT